MLDLPQNDRADPAALRGQARALADQRRFREAVALGQRAARENLDSAFAAELVKWRHHAFFTEPPPAQGRPDWPPHLPDPFPDLVDAIPEITPAQLSPDLLGGALLHHGSLIMRGLLSREETANWVADIDRAYTSRERTPDSDPDLYTPLHAVDDRALNDARVFSDGTSMLSADAPRLLTRWIDVIERSGVLAAVKGYLGEDPVLSASKARMYRVPRDAGSQWHQDGAFLGGKTVRTVNLWVTLTDCGEDAPGLELIPWRIEEIQPTGTHGSYFNWSVGEQLIPELAQGRRTVSPIFKAGDAMMFDHLCLHRTGTRPAMTRGRYALETWMFAPSAYADITPIVL